MVCLSRPYHFKFLKGCLPQISHGPFLNTLTHISQIFTLISFQANVPLMKKPYGRFLLAKCVKNTCERVTFQVKMQVIDLRVDVRVDLSLCYDILDAEVMIVTPQIYGDELFESRSKVLTCYKK